MSYEFDEILKKYNKYDRLIKNNNLYYGKVIKKLDEIIMNGKGILTNNKLLLKGKWENNKLNYDSVLISKNNEKYVGKFNNGVFNGIGNYIKNKDGYIKGNFLNGKVNNQALLENKKNNYYYAGKFKNNQFSGIGFYKDNLINFEGNFNDNVIKGKGNIKFNKNNENYFGNWENGIFEGEGKYQYDNNNSYKGSFKNGYRNGYGISKIKDMIYFGNFKNNKKEGIGKLIWKEKVYLIGYFSKDKIHGYSEYYNHDIIYKGFWENNKLNGLSIIIENNKNSLGLFNNNDLIKYLDIDKYEKDYYEILNREKKLNYEFEILTNNFKNLKLN